MPQRGAIEEQVHPLAGRLDSPIEDGGRARGEFAGGVIAAVHAHRESVWTLSHHPHGSRIGPPPVPGDERNRRREVVMVHQLQGALIVQEPVARFQGRVVDDQAAARFLARPADVAERRFDVHRDWNGAVKEFLHVEIFRGPSAEIDGLAGRVQIEADVLAGDGEKQLAFIRPNQRPSGHCRRAELEHAVGVGRGDRDAHSREGAGHLRRITGDGHRRLPSVGTADVRLGVACQKSQ